MIFYEYRPYYQELFLKSAQTGLKVMRAKRERIDEPARSTRRRTAWKNESFLGQHCRLTGVPILSSSHAINSFFLHK